MWLYITVTLPRLFNKEKTNKCRQLGKDCFVCQLNHKSWALGSNCQLIDGNTLCLVIAVSR